MEGISIASTSVFCYLRYNGQYESEFYFELFHIQRPFMCITSGQQPGMSPFITAIHKVTNFQKFKRTEYNSTCQSRA